jgi:hypothetical protein
LLKQALHALVAAGGNKTKAARALRMPRKTLADRLDEAERHGIAADPGATPPADEATLSARERIAAQDRIRDLEAQIKAIHREDLTAENVRQAIFGLAAVSAEPPRWVVEPRAKRSVTGTPCTLWSDWHWGEVVDPAQVNGVNKFNLAIAQTRLRTLVEHTNDLCFGHMTNPVYPGIVVNLGGDMISGDIHEELSETNELPTMPVMVDLFGKLAWALRTLADKFGRVFVPCVAGNHGRNTKKPRLKNYVYSNFDWLLYTMLEAHFKAAKDDRIAFMIPPAADAYYRVYGHRYLLTHGNNLGVKGGDGIIGALGPILRGDIKIRNANGRVGQPFDTLLMGHWHQQTPLFPRVCVNGSLKGYDEFAKLALRAPPEEPQQALWFTHPSRGVTCYWPVQLGPKKAVADVAWCSWPENRHAA